MAGSNHKPCAPAMTTTRKSTWKWISRAVVNGKVFLQNFGSWILDFDGDVGWLDEKEKLALFWGMAYQISFFKTSAPPKKYSNNISNIWGEHESILIIWVEEYPKLLWVFFLKLMHRTLVHVISFSLWVSLHHGLFIWSLPPSGTVFHQMGHLPPIFPEWKRMKINNMF